MSGIRVLSVILAVFVAGSAAYWVLGQSANPRDDAGGAAPKDLPGGDPSLAGRLFDDPPEGVKKDPAKDASDEDPLKALEHWKGKPTKKGDKVDVRVLPPVPSGDSAPVVSEYAISRTVRTGLRGGDAVVANRVSEGVTVKVVGATTDGGRRVELRRKWFKLQMLGGPVLSGEYDSRTPDDEMRHDPRFAPQIESLTVLLDAPYEITLDANGAATAIRGVERARELVQDALGRLGVPRARDLGPTPEVELESYRSALFPPIGGGTMEAGQPRKYRHREDTQALHWATFDGELDVTNAEGDTFCVTLSHCVNGAERFQKGNTLATGQELVALRIPATRDGLEASWVFDRAKGRLLSARVHPKYELWLSFMGTDEMGAPEPTPTFYVVEQLLSVDLVQQDGE